MKKRPGWLHKFFSYSRWQRRFGAYKAFSHINQSQYNGLKETIIEGQETVLTRGSSNDVNKHVDALRKEFTGQSELALHHALVIVKIRREYHTQASFRELKALWEAEETWLLRNLNARWLIAASDSYADHDSRPTVQALALATSVLANTVKIYETEATLSNADRPALDASRLEEVGRTAIPLFDGMSCLTVGTDDTLRNMVWRVKAIAQDHVTGRILLELLQRFNQLPTAYYRMRIQHTRKKTQWWD